MKLEIKSPYKKSTWKKFTDTGLLWWINRQLHLFGWVIVVEEDNEGKVKEAYPAKCICRGFSIEIESKCFAKLTKHISNNIKTLLKDSKN